MKLSTVWSEVRDSWRACRNCGLPDSKLRAVFALLLLLTPLSAALDGSAALLLVALLVPAGGGDAGAFAQKLASLTGAGGAGYGLLALTIAAFLLRAALTVVSTALDGIGAADLRRRVQERCLENLLRGRWESLRQGQVGQWSGALTEEAAVFAKYVMSEIRAVYYLGACLVLAAIALWTAPWLSLAGAGVTVPIWLLLKFLYARQSSLSAAMTARRQAFAADAVERLAGLFQIKAAGEEALQLQAAIREQGPMTRVEKRLSLYAGAISAFQLVLVPLMLGLLGFSSWSSGRPLGEQIATLGSLGLIAYRGLGQLNNFVASVGNLTRLSGCVHPILRLSSLPRAPELPALPAALARVELDHVSYAIDGRAIVSDLSLKASRGSLLLLGGPSGAGKSTVANMIAGLIEPASGEVLYMDSAGGRWSSRQRRPRVGYVTQDVHLFRGSVRDNLDPGRRLGDDALRRCLERAGAWNFVSGRGGLDAALAEAGRSLSGGERRRLAIAHALAQDSDCLILDEVTNGLDEEAKRGLVETIDALSRDGIVIAITHDLAAFSHLKAARVDLAASGRTA